VHKTKVIEKSMCCAQGRRSFSIFIHSFATFLELSIIYLGSSLKFGLEEAFGLKISCTAMDIHM